MKLYVLMALLVICAVTMACADSAAQESQPEKISVAETESTIRQNDLGALSPEEAFDYMKKTPKLLIVDAATTRWYQTKTFEGAVNVPVEELSDSELTEAVKKLPTGQPILVHCRRGMVAPRVYRRIKEVRPDVPEISWLNGTPLFDEYNAWVKSEHKK